VQIRLLGAVEVDGAGPTKLSGARRKAVLAALALRAGELLTVEALLDAVWGDDRPATAVNTLQHHVRHLRLVLGAAGTIRWQTSGYLLPASPDVTDLLMARRLVEEARTAPADAAAELLTAASRLWRGDPLSDLSGLDWFAGEAERLADFRLATTEALVEARLARGEHAGLVAELDRLVRDHPFRERLRAAHMLALYGAGRQNEALASYREVRRLLDDELGVDPGPALRALEASILRQDPALDVAAQRAPVSVRSAAPVSAQPSPGPSPGPSPDTPAPAGPWLAPPVPITAFVGRQEERARLLTALGTSRVVTLLGAGGAGKTRLALETAASARGRFPDGVAFVDLSGLAAGEVVRQVADVLGVLEEDDDELLGALRAALGGRSMLLVLDNCEHVVAAVAPLAESLAGSCLGLRVLATSRQPLGTYGEARLVLDPLPQPGEVSPAPDDAELAALRDCPSVALLLHRAAAVAAGFEFSPENAAVLARICRRLDGIPLALELAAARLAVLTPEELLAGLDDRFALLSNGPRTWPSRHQTLRAALDWGYELLDDQERRVLRRFSVFASPAPLARARDVCLPGAGPAGLDVLLGLVEKSLLVRAARGGQTRVRMHETVRQYGRQVLDGTPDEARDARAAHAATMLDVVREQGRRFHGPDEQDALAAVREVHPDLQAALAWAVEHDRETALGFVRELWWYWFRTGKAAEGRRWGQAVAPPAQRSPTCDEAFALAAGAYLAWLGDDFDAAAGAAQRAVDVAEQAPDAAALAYGVLARVAGDLDRPDQAAAAARQAEDLHADAGDAWGELWSRRCRAGALMLRGDEERAGELVEECLAGFRRLGDTWGVAGSVDLLAGIVRRLGDHGRAAALAREAVGQHRAFGDTSGTRYALQNLADAALAAGDDALARSAALESLELSTQHGYRFGALCALLTLGEVEDRDGARAAAVDLTEQAERLARELGDTELEKEAAERLSAWGR
jgi:predicted ATPase/DNA-binding SARP family transcriptional activator